MNTTHARWLLIAGLLASACAIEGNGVPGRALREVALFEGVEIAGGDNLEVIVSATHKDDQRGAQLELVGDENLLEHIQTRVSGGRLVITTEDCLEPRLPLELRVAVPSLRAVDISGDGRLTARNLGAPSVEVDISGDGRVSLEGQANTLTAVISGDGRVLARGLEVERAHIGVSGDGSITTCVHERLEVQISGDGEVTYYCDPDAVDQDISGDGRVSAGQ
jgi:hypothetical protein